MSKSNSTPFQDAVDAAIDAANADFLASAEAQEAARRQGDIWRHIMAAEDAAGPHAVVLPVGLARDLLVYVSGVVDHTRSKPLLPRRLATSALRDRIGQAERRTEPTDD